MSSSLPVTFSRPPPLLSARPAEADLSLAAPGLAANQQKTIEAASSRAARTRACHGPHRQRQDAVVVLLFADAQREIAQRLFRRRSRRDPACRHQSGALGCFPPDGVQPIAVAEESGSPDVMLLDLATLGDRQVDEQTRAFASLCEPVVIVVLGALVGGPVVAMYLPIVQLGNVV
jgi:hypothetical protein